MQDDNTNQATGGNQDDDGEPNVIEPTIGLGTNPLEQHSGSENNGTDETTDSQPAADDNPSADDTPSTTVPVNDAPADDSSPVPDDGSEESEEKVEPEEQLPEAPAPIEEETKADASQSDGDLESIRTSALQELTPIVSELDQEPEEKYRTLMMIIQASDNQSLIKEAYETAEKIDDKKARAEALLTIVNEINYFTGKDDSQPEV